MATKLISTWDGSAWRNMLFLRQNREWKEWTGSEWTKYGPFRFSRSWAKTRFVMQAAGANYRDPEAWHAPIHMWDDEQWYPAENTVSGQRWEPQSDGGVRVVWYVTEAGDHNHSQPAKPMPPISWWFTSKAGADTDMSSAVSGTVVVRVRMQDLRWMYTVALSSAAIKFLAGNWDQRKPTWFGVDGEGQYGPYEVWFPSAPFLVHGQRTPPPVQPHPPGPVTGFTGTATGLHTVRLTWHAVTGATGYHLWSGGKDYGVVHGTSYPVTGLAHAGTSYPFTIKAINKDGVSPPTPTHVTTKAAPVDHSTIVPITIKAIWDAAYDGNHSRRSDHPSNPWQSELVTGRFDSTHGNTHSVVRFDLSHIPKGATITSVRLTMYALHWFSNAGGTAVIRNIHLGGHALNRHSPESSGHTTDMHWGDRPWAAKTVSIADTAAQRANWGNGTVNAIQIGLSHTTGQAGYGVFDGTGSRRPVLEVKYHL